MITHYRLTHLLFGASISYRALELYLGRWIVVLHFR